MVSIQYECETDFDLGLDCEALAKLVAEKVLDSVPAAAVVGQNAKTYLQWMGESKLG